MNEVNKALFSVPTCLSGNSHFTTMRPDEVSLYNILIGVCCHVVSQDKKIKLKMYQTIYVIINPLKDY